MISECPNEVVCSHCGQSGHKKNKCEELKKETYGEYYEEIREGLEEDHVSGKLEESVFVNTENETSLENSLFEDNKVIENTTSAQSLRDVLLIGDSHMNHISMTGENVNVIQKSGMTYECIDELLCSKPVLDIEMMPKHVVVHLGTNDMMKSKGEPHNVQISIIEATGKVQEKFPGTNIVLSSILPRKGGGVKIQEYNSSVKEVNKFMEKFCSRTEKMQFVDNTKTFLQSGNAKKKLFSATDQSGIHLSETGQEVLKASFCTAINSEFDSNKSDAKRKRDEDLATPPSQKKESKVYKQ